MDDTLYLVGEACDLLSQQSPSQDPPYRCIYLEPPYRSGRDYKLNDSDPTAAFTDRMSVEEYRKWLDRLVGLCRSRLATNGTLWFHIASEYSMVPEQILSTHFPTIEKVFWKRSHGKNTVRHCMGSVMDILFRCAVSKTPIFHPQWVPLDGYYFEHSYRNRDAKGLYALGSLRSDRTRSGHKYEFVLQDTKKGSVIKYTAPNGWKISLEEMTRLRDEDRLHTVAPTSTRAANLYKKLYKDECKGKPLSNLWDDISYITRSQKDPRLYPTQKPVALLQRILAISTDPGDHVLDPTAGSGTTGIAAASMGRKCTMMDISASAQAIYETRKQSCHN